MEPRKALIACRGGPEHGPYSAQVLKTIRKILEFNNIEITGIYAVSGSCSTAVLGCIKEEQLLCDIWRNLTPQDIVGPMEEFKSLARLYKNLETWKTFMDVGNIKDVRRVMALIKKLKQGHALDNAFLIKLIKKHSLNFLDRIFSPEACLLKIAAVDYLTAQKIIFSNKIPEHKDILIAGMVGSMCLVPWFPSITIDNPVGRKLVERVHPMLNDVFMIDGGYRASILLEEAIREQTGYDLIFIVDIHGLEVGDIDIDEKYNTANRIRRTVNILTNTNDKLAVSLIDRIDEEIHVKEEIVRVLNEIPPNLAEITEKLRSIVEKMDNGRLRLHDKHHSQRIIISNPDRYRPFDFTDFTEEEVIYLMTAGHDATLKALGQAGFNIPEVILPV